MSCKQCCYISGMKILVISVSVVFVFVISLLTVKFWGQAQVYPDYQHVMQQGQATKTSEAIKASEKTSEAIEFIKPSYQNLKEIYI